MGNLYSEIENKLLELYMVGFDDELHSRKTQIYDDLNHQNAYNTGRIDAYVGDYISSIDEQTSEDILRKLTPKGVAWSILK